MEKENEEWVSLKIEEDDCESAKDGERCRVRVDADVEVEVEVLDC